MFRLYVNKSQNQSSPSYKAIVSPQKMWTKPLSHLTWISFDSNERLANLEQQPKLHVQ